MLRALRISAVTAASLGATFSLTALGLSAPAQAAAVSAVAPASAQIVASGGLKVISALILPSVSAFGAGSAGFSGTVVYGSNARLTIRHEAGEALTLTVPSSFTVVRTGGSEALTVTTSTRSDFGIAGDGILLDGGMMHGVATSVDIGGMIAMASGGKLVPGPYEGVLAVVVEYN